MQNANEELAYDLAREKENKVVWPYRKNVQREAVIQSVADLQRYKWYIGTGPTFQNENLGAYLSCYLN